MNIVFIGCPGSGKGTQAKFISQKLNMTHFSPGDIFWKEVAEKTTLGQEVADDLAGGRLVPDWLVLRLLKDKFGAEKRGILFDGFPRTHEQAEALDDWLTANGRTLNAAIYLKLPEAEGARRLELRNVCGNCGMSYGAAMGLQAACGACGAALIRRVDDKPEIVKKRMLAYRDQTEPLLSYYSGNGVLREINADQPQQAVTTQIALALKSII